MGAAARRMEERIVGAPVRVVDLVKRFGPVQAVAGVSLDVRGGEFLALLGPSGSGKTTILMSVAGFETPTAGDILIAGRPVTHVPPNRRNLGMVFQTYALFPHMTVWENIAFPLRMRRVPGREIATRVAQALDLVRLAGYGSRRPARLSGGQQQRVALARAIVFRPSVLLMDEPLGALDKKLREQMQLEIKRLQQKLGATVLYVTHDQEEALTMADRIAVLNEGRLEQLGPPEELYEQPANSFVADFIGETNFLEGRVQRVLASVCMVALGDGLAVRARLPGMEPPLAEGAAVRVAVRPERVAVRRPGEGEEAGYAGVVQETVYAGGTVACVVRLAGRVALTARVPSGGGAARWRVGDAVDVTWRSEDARVYPRDGR